MSKYKDKFEEVEIGLKKMNWNKRFKAMINHNGLTLKDVAEITGNSYGSIRSVLSSEEFPRWAKLAVVLFEKQNLKNQENV